MQRTSMLLAMMLMTGLVHADSDCATTAAEKKLSGAAKTSFMQKCERESTCDLKAADKKLAGAAKTSFVKKCITDAKAASKS